MLESGVAEPAICLPLSAFEPMQNIWVQFLDRFNGVEVCLYCRTGRRAEGLKAKLQAGGVRCTNLGGMGDWIAAGLPVRRITENEILGLGL